MGAAPAPPDDIDALRSKIAQLQERLATLEAERDEYAQQVEELFVLQQVFSTLGSSLELTDILSTVLRGAIEALKFGRVILFDVLESGTILRRLECTRDGGVEPSADERAYRPDSALQAIARGEEQLAFGSAHDERAPLDDTRHFYCAAALFTRNVLRGILYADDPPKNEISDNQMRMLLDFASQAAIAIENARLYEETRRLLEETQRLALTDSLTGIANRRALHELFEHELRTAERYGTPLAFAILDLDDLKTVNDTRGHSMGDAALRRFAEVLTRNARRGDIVARYAGDEFVLVMIRTSRSAANKAAERILNALREAEVPASIGIAMYPDDATDAQAIFFAADEALYAAKLAGKNCSRFYRNPDQPLDAAAT